MFTWLTRRLDGRLYEWVIATPTIAMGVQMAIWPNTITLSAFQLISVSVSGRQLAWIAIFVGAARLFALAINGSSDVVGPIIRSVCAFISALLWGQFAYALFLMSMERGIPSPGLSFWVSITLAEIYVSYRAVMDVRRFVQ